VVELGGIEPDLLAVRELSGISIGYCIIVCGYSDIKVDCFEQIIRIGYLEILMTDAVCHLTINIEAAIVMHTIAVTANRILVLSVFDPNILAAKDMPAFLHVLFIAQPQFSDYETSKDHEFIPKP
jgi:hypothetical protein